MSDAIEWKTKDVDGAGSYGVVTCQGPFLGELVRGSVIISEKSRTIFRISLFCLSSGGWIPFIDSHGGIFGAEDVFEALSLRSRGVKIDQAHSTRS